MKEKFWSSEKILGVSAIMISLGMFASIVYQNNLIQKQQSASVLPYLEIWNSQAEDRYQLILINNGIGPAFIKEIRIVYKNGSYNKDPWGFFEDVLEVSDSIADPIYYSNIKVGQLIPAGKRTVLIGVDRNKASADFLRSHFGDEKVARLEIEYESVYENRWLTSGLGNAPILID